MERNPRFFRRNMESPSIAKFVPAKSNKKVFSEESSIDLDVFEISPPPVNRSSKSKALKITEVTNKEVIDVDVDEKHGNMNFEGKAYNKYNGKRAARIHTLAPLKLSLESVYGDQSSKKSSAPESQNIVNINGFRSDFTTSKRGFSDVSLPTDLMQAFDDGQMYNDKNTISQSQLYNIDIPSGVEAHVSWSTLAATESSKESILKLQRSGKRFLPGSPTDLGTPAASSSKGKNSAPPKHVHEDEILKNFEQFKKFDIVEDPSDHHYVKYGNSAKQPSMSWSKKIQEEWKILEKNLPDTIFVRAYESRMDLLRAVIIGAEGTPYHDGLFFFDVFFPDNYPNVPPQVYYYSRGLRLNPNLYNSGKVCLSLLNTWSGSQKEKWIPKLSTMLQVLVSIQGLILNAKPYFNEPGCEGLRKTPQGEKSSLQYNESTFIFSLKTMVFTLRKQPKHFEDFVLGHFFKRAREILVACKAYMDGAQVGCLVSGGVQDVDEGDKSCSNDFRSSLSGYIKEIVNAFTGIGVKDCTKIIPPAKTDYIQFIPLAKSGKRQT